MNNCPVCRSSKYRDFQGNFKCERCGYIRKSMEVLDKEFNQQEKEIEDILKY